jgi:osmoprotectant transport system permease protein
VTGIEHGLAYRALDDGAIDVTDAYSTDGEMAATICVLLRDDRRFFPEYLAVPLARGDLPAAVLAALAPLGGLLDDATMQTLNAEVVFASARSPTWLASSWRAAGWSPAPARAKRGALWGATPCAIFSSPLRRLAGAVLIGVALSLAVFRRRALAERSPTPAGCCRRFRPSRSWR